MKEENFSPQQSLLVIQEMIGKARQSMGDNAKHFLLWGWVCFIACVSQFVLKTLVDYQQHYLVWLLTLPAAVVSIIMGRKQERSKTATSYVGESMKHLWIGMGIAFFVLSMILTRLGWGTNIFPFFILLYGLGTFISGKFLQFNPFVWGGLAAWVLAVAATFFNYDYQMLFGAAAILISYIIPSYLLQRKNSKATM
ncbi:MAG: hypothetical protein EOO03_07470 [Chitinophagaceae bacterium]|nr:MAG: hypothetical protein EOO03_07470 [Chitinophagaceae bacterium]